MRQIKRNHSAILTTAALAACLSLGAGQAIAANGTWSGAGDGTSWSDSANWVGGIIPGDTSGALSTNTDTATFGTGGVAFPNITVDAGRTIKSITLSAGYTIGSTSGNAITMVSSGTVSGTGAAIDAPIVLASNPNFTNGANQVLTFNGDISTNDTTARTLNTFNYWGTLKFGGHVSGPINIRPAVTYFAGQRLVQLNNSNTNTSGVAIDQSWAVVELNHAGAITDSRLTAGRGATFIVNADNAITGSSYVSVSDNQSGTNHFYGILTYNNPNDYTGGTTIGSAGGGVLATGAELYANNASGSATGSGDVTVNKALLGGDGFIVTDTTHGVLIKSTGRLSPGAAAGVIGTLTMDVGDKGLDITGAVGGTNLGALLFDLAALGSSDRVSLLNTSVLKIGAGALEFDDFAFNALAGFGPGVYTLFDTGSTISGSLGSNLSGSIGAYTGTLRLANSNQDVVLTVVPEPGSLGILAMGELALLTRRRNGAAHASAAIA